MGYRGYRWERIGCGIILVLLSVVWLFVLIKTGVQEPEKCVLASVFGAYGCWEIEHWWRKERAEEGNRSE